MIITLKDFLSKYYPDNISITATSARAFGIPYPLRPGWAKRYQNNTAELSHLTFGKRKLSINTNNTKSKVVFTTGVYKPLCNCTTPPWEDCEHTIDQTEKESIKILLSF